MDNRKYNIYFNTHTISGIIICAILYVIFFAGSFSFFKNDIAAWQKNESYVSGKATAKHDFNYLLDSLATARKLKGRDFDFYMQHNTSNAYVSMTASKDTTVKAQKSARKKPDGKRKRHGRGRGRGGDDDSAYFTYNLSKHKEADYTTSYTMGEFLYRLHFLAQLNQVLPFNIGVPFGYMLAGIVAFIFLFALITGLLLHWDKLVSNFFTFRPWNKWKTVWTELHTVLGVIGFPYQLVFAITGIVLIFNTFLIAPYTALFYKGDTEKIYKDLGYGNDAKYDYTYTPLNAEININSFVEATEKRWQQSDISMVAIRNYGDDNMHVLIKAIPHNKAQMNGTGEITYRVRDGKVISEKPPLSSPGYIATVRGMLYHLHFGDYGGRPLRVIYFVLGIMGCIVINSGVMIWLVARDKKSIPERKRKFNFWTANVYLASSLSMLPVLAFTMIALLYLDKPDQETIYHWFFYPWLALGIYFLVLRNLDRTNRHSTFLSAILCLLLPVLDGIKRNNWVWVTYKSGAYDILFIDLLFFILGLVSAVIWWKMVQKQRLKNAAETEKKTLATD